MTRNTDTQTALTQSGPADEDIERYDLTRQRLREMLTGQLPETADLESVATAYAYWVCSIVEKRGAEWEPTLREFAGYALRDGVRETEAEQAEYVQLRRALREVRSGERLLDVGAGWGRMAPLYGEARLRAVFVEPARLGARLMGRDGLGRVVAADGEDLPFSAGTFGAVLVGWVLHHHSAELDAARLLAEAARVLAPGGWFISIEPVRASFDEAGWRGMLAQAGIAAGEAHEFYRMSNDEGKLEFYTLIAGQKRA